MADLTGKTAFISAATSVVGRACATALSASGARVCLADADAAAAASLARTLAPATTFIGLDSCDEGSWQEATAHCLAELQALDILVHCEGCFDGSRPIIDTPLEDFKAALYGSGMAGWLALKHGILTMRKAGRGGAIVQVTSILGRVATANAAASCAAAAGVVMAARAAALECAKHGDGIVVNTVLAAPVAGDDGQSFPDANSVPGATVVAPGDVAEAVLFLASDGAAYMTGTELPVDGGFLSR